MKLALSVAGSDPTGGAGLQLDVQVFRSLGLHGAAVPTALTIQDSHGVKQVLPSFPSVVLDQLRVLLADIRPAAVKIGMLATDDVVRNVALALSGLDAEIPIVLDPVLASSDGKPLLERRAFPALSALFPRATVLTPNRPEAFELTGEDAASDAGAERAARALIEDQGARAVLVKGGHRDGAPRDLLAVPGGETLWFEGQRDPGGPVHGTGCALAAAIAAKLALGGSLVGAVEESRRFVADAIARSHALGGGARFLGF